METLITFIVERGALILLRATLILGPMFLVFWILKPNFLRKFRIHQPKETKPRYLTDLLLTVLGLLVYLIPIFCLGVAREKFGFSKFYLNIEEYGYGYFALTLFYFMFVTDTWFYWTHRLMHSWKFLKAAHGEHHKSYNVTPLTSYSFHIVEALINMLPFFVVTFTIPIHPQALFVFSMFGIVYLGYIHLGYDFAFHWRTQNPVFKWLYTSTHHSIHHQRYDGNYGVYFTFWDKLMGTELMPVVEKTEPTA